MVGRKPAAPLMPAMMQSAGRKAASISPGSPAATSMPLPASRSESAWYFVSSAMTASSARWRSAHSASASTLLCAVSATISNMPGLRPITSRVLVPTEPVAPSTLTRLGTGADLGRPVLAGSTGVSLARMAGTPTSEPSRPQQKRMRWGMHVDDEACQPHRRRRGDQPVDTIHHAAVAWYQRT